MSRRDEVLVSTDWVAEHADDPAYRLVEVDEDTTAYAGGHIRNADRLALEGRPARGAAPRVPRPGDPRRAAGALRRGPGHDRRALRRQQQLVRHLRLLAAALPRLRPGQADGRRAQEVGARGARAGDRRAVGRARPTPAPWRRCATSCAPSATTCWATSAATARRWSTCAARPSSRARCWRRRTCPRSRPRCRATSRARPTCPGRRPPARTARFKSDEELTEIYGGVGVTPDTDVIAYCRIGERSSHTWFVLHELLGYDRGAQLRRLLDRVRQPRRRARRAVGPEAR